MLNQAAALDLGPARNDAGAQDEPRADILDHGALDNIRVLQKPGKPNLLEKIVRFYLRDAPRLMQTMGDAVSAADRDALLRAAHTMKSSSANLGALKLAQLCKEMEEEARGAAIPHASARIVLVEHEFKLVRAALCACIGDTSND